MNEQDLKIVGVDDNGDARIVELSDHRFFMATLFLPQSSSSIEKPHPLIVEYLNVAKAFQGIKQKVEIEISPNILEITIPIQLQKVKSIEEIK